MKFAKGAISKQSLAYTAAIAACLLLIATVVWIQGETVNSLRTQVAKLSASVSRTSSDSSKAQAGSTASEQSAWKLYAQVDLPDVVLKQYCSGSVEAASNQPDRICSEHLKIMALVKKTGKEYLLVEKNLLSYLVDSADSTKQLGSIDDANSRLLFSIGGLADCDNDFMGCSYNYTIKLADLANPSKLVHVENSEYMQEGLKWNADYTRAIGLYGVCEGGCIPSKLNGYRVTEGHYVPLSQDEAWINPQHYEGRIPDYQKNAYTHWGEIKWTDATHYQAQLLDPNGKIIKTIRGEFK